MHLAIGRVKGLLHGGDATEDSEAPDEASNAMSTVAKMSAVLED